MADSPNTGTLSEFHSRRAALARIAGTLALATGATGAVAVTTAAEGNPDAEILALCSEWRHAWRTHNDLISKHCKIEERWFASGRVDTELERLFREAEARSDAQGDYADKILEHLAALEPQSVVGLAAISSVLIEEGFATGFGEPDPTGALLRSVLKNAVRLGGKLS